MPIPKSHREQIDTNPFFRVCVRASESNCEGRITIDHAVTYAGKRLNEMWCYVPVCMYHHGLLGSGGLDKTFNRKVALSRATPEELAKYPRL